MKKIIIALFALMGICESQAQILYKISGNDLKDASYILGTYHLEDSKYVDKIPGAKEAVNACQQVYGELPFDDMLNPDSLALMSNELRLPEGKTIKDILTAEQFSRLDKFVEKEVGMALSNPMLYGQMGGMTPAALNNTLTVLMFMKKSQGQINPQDGLDNYFQKVAKAAGKPVLGFETTSYQVDVLFHSSTMERQIEQLMCLVDNSDIYSEMSDKLIDAYHSQDMEEITKVMDMKLNSSCDDTQEEKDRLITNRNLNWVKLMPAIMKDKSTFFAVGAGHLGGEKGVLQLLKNAGYTVEGVK